MPNNRIFYACQAVAIEPLQANQSTGALEVTSNGVQVLHGVQSVGLNTTFNLEQVFELGQIHIYENIEGVPDVEVTLEKVLDGFPLMYHLATCGVENETGSASKQSLVARSKQRCNVYLGIFPDTVEHIADAAANATAEVQMSGMYVSSLSYTLPTDGNCTESLTLVGNHKAWNTSKFTSAVAAQLDWTGAVGNLDKPKNLQAGTNSIFPKGIYGVANNANAQNAWNSSQSKPNVHFQNISISTDLSREDIQELGRKAPYYRFASFPVEVTCEFEVIAISGDFVNAYEEGAFGVNNENYGNNTSEETIMIKLHDGTVFDLGTKSRLASVNYTGGDAGGGNGTITYSYSTYNSLTVTHPSDLISSKNNPTYAPSYNGT
jgi:hypothetical protein